MHGSKWIKTIYIYTVSYLNMDHIHVSNRMLFPIPTLKDSPHPYPYRSIFTYWPSNFKWISLSYQDTNYNLYRIKTWTVVSLYHIKTWTIIYIVSRRELKSISGVWLALVVVLLFENGPLMKNGFRLHKSKGDHFLWQAPTPTSK